MSNSEKKSFSSYRSLASNVKKRIESLKKESKEDENKYIKKVGPKLTDIRKVLLPNDEEIESIENIIRDWRSAINTYNVSPWFKLGNNGPLYNRLHDFFRNVYLQKKYKHKRNVLVIKTTIQIFRQKLKPSRCCEEFFGSEKYVYKKYIDEVLKKNKKYIENDKIKLIVFHVGLEWDTGAHSCSIIINKYLKTIEYYDPNGAQVYKDVLMFDDFFQILNEKFTKQYGKYGYKFLNYDETNLKYGIQYFMDRMKNYVTEPTHGIYGVFYSLYLELMGKSPKELLHIGFCAVHTNLILDYRIHYPQIPPLILQKLLLIQLSDNDYKFKEDITYFDDYKPTLEIESKIIDNCFRFFLNYLRLMSRELQNPKIKEYINEDYYQLVLDSSRPFSKKPMVDNEIDNKYDEYDEYDEKNPLIKKKNYDFLK